MSFVLCYIEKYKSFFELYTVNRSIESNTNHCIKNKTFMENDKMENKPEIRVKG